MAEITNKEFIILTKSKDLIFLFMRSFNYSFAYALPKHISIPLNLFYTYSIFYSTLYQ